MRELLARLGSRRRKSTRTVWFHRGHGKLIGGTLKLRHYFDHVAGTPGFEPKIVFSGDSSGLRGGETASLFPSGAVCESWDLQPGDIVFLSGGDWSYLDSLGHRCEGSPDNPIVWLGQGFKACDRQGQGYQYLARKAVRICVSREVAAALAATGQPVGPIRTIPAGTELAAGVTRRGDDPPPAFAERRWPAVVVGYKRPDLARALSLRLEELGVEHRLLLRFIDREQFLGLLRQAQVAVCLGLEREGFYLPAIEAMACGSLLVTLDSVGNRSFCRHDDNCLIADADRFALSTATIQALGLSGTERRRQLRKARQTCLRHSLEVERKRFRTVLRRLDRLWSD